MKLLLIQPPVQDFYDTAIRLQPLGLCALKAIVRERLPRWEVSVKDYHHGRGRRTITVPPELAYLKAYYAFPDASPFSTFYQYYHFGASFDDIAAEVAAEQPDIVGISALFSAYFREALRCAEAIKARRNAPILLGGSHVSAAPESALRHPCVDFVIRGEGERPLIEFLAAWQQGRDFENVPNFGFKRGGQLVLTPLADNYPLDELPPPDFSDFPPNRYLFEQRPMSMVMTSRGCPHRCAFCAVHLTFGDRYRRRANDLILEEIAARYAQGCRVFDFEDDNLTFDTDAMRRLCDGLIALFPKRDAQFLAMNGLSYHSLNRELLALMKRAGFTHLNLSLVSADAETRRQSRRPHSFEQYVEVVRAGAELGFQIVAYQILGLPHESLDAMVQTMAANAGLPALLGASPCYITPNMPMAQAFPPMSDAEMFAARLTAMARDTAHVTRDDVFTLFVTARIINFLKGLALPNSPISCGDALNWAERQGGRAAVGATLLRRLFAEKRLYAAVGAEFKPVARFQPALFFRVWSALTHIQRQHGQRLSVQPYSRSSAEIMSL